MKDLKDQKIEKLTEIIHEQGLYIMELDMPEILSEEHLDRINKIKMGILHLEKELSALDEKIKEEGVKANEVCLCKENRGGYLDITNQLRCFHCSKLKPEFNQ